MVEFSNPGNIYKFKEPPWFDNHYTNDQKTVYRNFREMMLNAYGDPESIRSLRIGIGNDAFQHISRIFIDVMEDNPMLFKWRMELSPLGGGMYKVSFTPIGDKNVLLGYENKILRKIIAVQKEYKITPSMSEIDIIRCVNKWLLKKKYSAYEGPCCHRALGIMLKGEGVCASFAAANHILLNAFGVECYTVSGQVNPGDKGSMAMDWGDYITSTCESPKSDDGREYFTIEKVEPDIIVRNDRRNMPPNPNHAWNVVGVDGYLFHSDPTFNNGHGNEEYLIRTIKGLKDRKSVKWDRFAKGREIPLSPYLGRRGGIFRSYRFIRLECGLRETLQGEEDRCS